MALTSPGLEIQVIDESTYLPSAQATVPLFVIATASNKTVNGLIASGTTDANAGILAAVSSQRELINRFGLPVFRETSPGTPANGSPINEYGLMAAYSALGLGNRAFVIRADIDLNAIVGSASRPVGEPANGTYWLNTADTDWGIFEWNASTKAFTKKTPRLATDLVGGAPRDTFGAVGDYAITLSTTDTVRNYYYKTYENIWAIVGSEAWQLSIPTLVASNITPTLSAGEIDVNEFDVIFAGGTLDSLVAQINAGVNSRGVYARNINGKLALSVSNSTKSNGVVEDGKLLISNITGDLLGELGIVAGTYYAPEVQISGYTTVPNWRTGGTANRPTGSVWVKTTAVGDGLELAVEQYQLDLSQWNPLAVPVYSSEIEALAGLDPTGGGVNILVGTLYAATDKSANRTANIEIFRRKTAGAVSVTGSVLTGNPFTVGNTFTIGITPANGVGHASYTVKLSTNTVLGFVSDIQAQNIPNFTATVNSNNSVTLAHTKGGLINLTNLIGTPVNVAGLGTSNTAHYPMPLKSGLIENTYSLQNVELISADYIQDEEPSTVGFSGGETWFDTSNGKVYFWTDFDGPWAVAGESQGYFTGTSFPGSPLGSHIFYHQTFNRVYVYRSDIAAWIEVWSRGDAAVGATFSGFEPLVHTFSATEPVATPADQTLWYYSDAAEVDIMINTLTGWKGYRNETDDTRGYNLTNTNPDGIIVAADEPETQGDGTPLVEGDIWLDSGDLVNYPRIYRYDGVEWNLIDNSDQVSSDGILFADARWGTGGNVDPASDNLPSIADLAVSDYLDIDAPDYRLYPRGMLLFNTRRSGFNVKRYIRNYFNAVRFPDDVLPAEKDVWQSVSGLKADGSMYAGPLAQRNMVVSAMRQAIDTNVAVREDQYQFNIIAAPGYPELISNLVALNNDRVNTAFIVGDTPMDLAPDLIEIVNWSNNSRGDGLSTSSEYLGVFYPAGLSNDLSGNQIVVPASHMILRTIMRSDNVSFPWFAPAGARRGTVDNATNIGYIDKTTGEFVTLGVSKSLRDGLYENRINPLTILPGTGLLNYGQKTRYALTSALDRINVARLINYMRTALQPLANNFLFEPNDKITRDQVKQSVEGLMNDLVAKRALYDYLVVCDDSNNTPDRIARNELYVDIAIAPVRSIEFIYIPLRIRNPGDI
jgi:hypothetical protein